MTPDERKAEDQFRQALIKYLKANDALSDDSILTHWYVIVASENMKDPEVSSVSAMPDETNPFPMQMGMVEYARVWLKTDLARTMNMDKDD